MERALTRLQKWRKERYIKNKSEGGSRLERGLRRGGCLISLQLFVHMERWDRRNLVKWFVGVPPPDQNTHFYTSHLCQLLVNTFFRETHPQSSLPLLPAPQWFPWCLSQHGCQVNQGESCQLQRPGQLTGCDVCPSEASGAATCQTGSAESEGWQRREERGGVWRERRWGIKRGWTGAIMRPDGFWGSASCPISWVAPSSTKHCPPSTRHNLWPHWETTGDRYTANTYLGRHSNLQMYS